MRAPARRLWPLLLVGLGVVALALPANALAHGIVGRADLPIPVWLFSWTAAIVLVVSFVALSTLWTTPAAAGAAPAPAVRPAGARGLAREPGRRGPVRAGRLQRLRRRSGHRGELLGDVHLRDLLGRHPGRERAVRRHLPRAQPVAACARAIGALGAAGARRAQARAAAALPASGSALWPAIAGDRGLRVAGADLRRKRQPVDAGGAVAGLLRW